MNPAAKLPDLVDGKASISIPVLLFREYHQVGIGPGLQRALDPLEAQHLRRCGRHGAQGVRDAGTGPLQEVVDALDQCDRAKSCCQRSSSVQIVSARPAHLPAIVVVPSSVRTKPSLMIWCSPSPFVHLYRPSGSPTMCIASVTSINPSGCALYAILMVLGCR